MTAAIPDLDLHLFAEGTHRRLYEQLGAQPGDGGCRFAVWAPSARAVHLVSDVDDWAGETELHPNGSSGVWSGWLDGAGVGTTYRFRITGPDGSRVDKSDPVGAAHHGAPSIDSYVADLSYEWGDGDWMATRHERNALDAPMSIYEVHLGSWGRTVVEGKRFPTYRDLAIPLAEHCAAHGFTHVEFLPLMEHPFYGSWGYQTTGYFAPTARYGTPQDLMAMVDILHQRGIGVIFDWVPSHFPTDEHGLARFDGTHLYEHADPRQGYHPDWNSAIFNYGRNEVRSFLTSSAMCWLDRFHADGLRVDAVASMLYLDYSRQAGEWIPNRYGGRENLEAIDFMRGLNEAVYGEYPDVVTHAEESTAWPGVSRPTYLGGLGFGGKWDMGWMHDTLQYLQRDPIHRSWHHGEITFRSVYMGSEHYVLPLSHDEVVHGKGSLLTKMPGDDWQQFANLRLLYAMQWFQPGKKLLFMGAELATRAEWNHDGTLDWSLHDVPMHAGVRSALTELNRLYRGEPALHRGDTGVDGHGPGMEWVEAHDSGRSVFAWLRTDPTGGSRPVLVVVNATPSPQWHYRLGVPTTGRWEELFNSDATEFGGSGMGNFGGVDAHPLDSHGRHQSVVIDLPPLSVIAFAPTR
ncbi:MAG: 1,4-alpha-glucan branching protein GlgB [Ilumatobacteraceae bacterium]